MRRKIHDTTMVHSSIVLLQERFRQLQRVKEMRKERELLKMLSTELKHFNSNLTTGTYEPTRRQFFHPELIIPSRSPPTHVSLSLWPTSQCMQQEDNKSTTETPVSMNLHSMDSTHALFLQDPWKKNIDDLDSASDNDSGVDTSLHL